MSAVWEYFKIKVEDTSIAICNTCNGEVKRGGSRTKSYNTTNQRAHLEHRHESLFKELKLKEKESAKTTQAPPKTTAIEGPIQQALDKVKPYVKDSAKAKSITSKIMEMIALDDQPFSIVEDQGFRRLIHHIDPRYTVPSRKHLTQVSLPALYDTVATHIRKMLENVNDVSFTTDIWSSDVNGTSMLSLTAQWIDENFEMQRAVLHAQQFNCSHTGQAIADAFTDMFARWKIPKNSVHVVLRDNARNMEKGMRDCGVRSLGCMAHTLQLAIHDGVLSQRSISDCIAIGRKIVGHFRHSPLATSQLKKIQADLGTTPKVLQQDVAMEIPGTLLTWHS